MMNRKYLEEIIPREEIFGWHDESDDRHERWCKQEEEYGFCDIETWDLDATFAQIIYERMKMFLEYADKVINLTMHSFEVDFLDTTLTLKEIVELIIVKTKQAIKTDNPDEYTEYMDVVWKLMTMVHKCLWW